jgi:hypothetical protein
MGPVLDSLGIGRDELVIFLDDITINGSLYLMGRKGYTNYGNDWSDPATFERLIARGARYLMFAEDRWLEDPVVKPYLDRPITRHKWVRIYDLYKGPETEENDLVLAAGSPLHPAVKARVDTIPCEGAGAARWCFGSGEYPLEMDELPAYGKQVLRTEVIVRGVFHMDGALATDESLLILAENDANGQISNEGKRLVEGPFEFRWMLLRHPYEVRNKLYLWNRSGKPFSFEGLKVEVRRVMMGEGNGPIP